MLGYHPQGILAGRRINDGMGKYVAVQTVKHLIQRGSPVKGADIVSSRPSRTTSSKIGLHRATASGPGSRAL
jgi:hypothetical protein